MARPDRLHRRPRPPARGRHQPKKGTHRPNEPDDHALGRSRGSVTTKIHLVCDGRRRPLTVLLAPGQRNDSVCVRPLQKGDPDPPHRPRPAALQARQVIADKTYSSREYRAYLCRRGITHHPGRDRPAATPPQPRPPVFDRQICRRRNLAERCFNRLKSFRAIAIRYDKTATSYEAAVSLASLLLRARSV
ncbi:IS5 family transposase (plasmid) [Streptomyces sp. AHU1]|uniref:IS5 family transposase n=1 Tax=Streptomyces sp. AHU1 TaxID=3377215 RepID=UPI00387822C0